MLLNQTFAEEITKTVPSVRAIPFDFTSPPARREKMTRLPREIDANLPPSAKFFP